MRTLFFRSVSRVAVMVLCCSQLVATSATAAVADGVQPDVSISLRGLPDDEVEVGESFRVAVRIDAPENSAAKLILAPATGSWIEATTVEILSTDGKVVPAMARPAAAVEAEASTAVDADNPANGLWWFTADSLKGVSVGDYLVRARLTIRAGSGWKGEALSEPAMLRVVTPSSDSERAAQRKLERARAAILGGEPAKGAEILNAMLEVDPDSVPTLALRAALSLEGENRGAARVCINRALMLSTSPGKEPSAELNELAVRIERPATGGTTASPLPVWTQVPRSVFAPIKTEASAIPGLGVEHGHTKETSKRIEVAAMRTDVATAPVPKTANSSVITASPGPALSTPVLSGAKSIGVIVPAAELVDATIRADAAGQWAATATAGSQYGRTQYSATQATGAPNINVQGNSPDAWCPAVRDKGLDWLEVTFAKPVQAVEVRVRQNDAAGALAKVEAFEADGTAHVWWEGVDPYQTPSVKEIVWFGVRVPETSYLVARVKLTLNLASGPGYKEIDAVQLVSSQP